MTLPLKNMDDQLTHPLTPHPPCNKQSNQQQKQKTKTNQKKSKKQTTRTHNNNHNKQTSKQTNKINNKTHKSQQKPIIRTRKRKSPPRSTYSTVFVLCYMLIVHLFLFCGFLSALVCLFCCCGWDKPNLNWMVKRQATLVGIRQKLTFCQLDDSTVPLWPSTAFSLTIAQSHYDRLQPSAWR